MEKDNFLDRTDDGCYYDKVEIGTYVLICAKNMQKYAEIIEDLEYIQIAEHLTSVKYHPRGQKVGGYDVKTGMYKKGRVVYIVEDGYILTKNGKIPYKYS